MTPRRYVSDEEDSDRWHRFPFRDGDIVVSSRSKSGTTWMQQICLSLVHGTAELPAPLGEMSPWVDWLVEPEDSLFARLEAQSGRRVLKTHTPLDGLVLDLRASFVVMVRDPLDMAVSLYHQGENLDRARVAELTGQPLLPLSPRPSLHEWLVRWTSEEADPMEAMDSLPGVVHHAADGTVEQYPGHQQPLRGDPHRSARPADPAVQHFGGLRAGRSERRADSGGRAHASCEPVRGVQSGTGPARLHLFHRL